MLSSNEQILPYVKQTFYYIRTFWMFDEITRFLIGDNYTFKNFTPCQISEKNFIKFLRVNKITYTSINERTLITKNGFPRLVFQFDFSNHYVTVWRPGDSGYNTKSGVFYPCIRTYSFPAPNMYRILAKLIRFGLVDPKVIEKLKY